MEQECRKGVGGDILPTEPVPLLSSHFIPFMLVQYHRNGGEQHGGYQCTGEGVLHTGF